jgi:hypothetical protein
VSHVTGFAQRNFGAKRSRILQEEANASKVTALSLSEKRKYRAKNFGSSLPIEWNTKLHRAENQMKIHKSIQGDATGDIRDLSLYM